jgi:hypothetical protein
MFDILFNKFYAIRIDVSATCILSLYHPTSMDSLALRCQYQKNHITTQIQLLKEAIHNGAIPLLQHLAPMHRALRSQCERMNPNTVQRTQPSPQTPGQSAFAGAHDVDMQDSTINFVDGDYYNIGEQIFTFTHRLVLTSGANLQALVKTIGMSMQR